MFQPYVIRCGSRPLILDRPIIMGVMNLNQDSFYSGSRFTEMEEVLNRARTMEEQGASIIDVGVMSSRPGAELISPKEEWEVLRKVLPQLRAVTDLLISVDTLHASTASNAISEGADLINDISGGDYDADMYRVVADAQAGYVLMHMRGTPQSMKSMTSYPEGVALGVLKELKIKCNRAQSAGLNNIIVDPGIGFAKTVDQNYQLLKELCVFHALGHPVLLGLSRKSLIWRTLESSPEEALNGTTALHSFALHHHPHILRVHDVKEVSEVLKLWQKLHPGDENTNGGVV